VQNIPRHPDFVPPFHSAQILHAFQDFVIHVILLAKRGPVAVDSWQTETGYTIWLYRVSHLLMIPPTEVVELPPPRPPNEDVIIEKDHVRDRPIILHIIWTVCAMAKEQVCDGDSVEYF
jgi:hypothetical protein